MALALACGHEPPPKTPGKPIVADPPMALRPMTEECDAMVTALTVWASCPNLDDGERDDVKAWIDRANEDFAAGRKVELDAESQNAIAAACHRAAKSIGAATERCAAGRTPKVDER